MSSGGTSHGQAERSESRTWPISIVPLSIVPQGGTVLMRTEAPYPAANWGIDRYERQRYSSYPPGGNGERVPSPKFLMGQSSRLVLHFVQSDTVPALPRFV
jgi:hypothetical protein